MKIVKALTQSLALQALQQHTSKGDQQLECRTNVNETILWTEEQLCRISA